MKSNLKFKKEKLGILIPTGNFISAISLILTVFLILLYLIKAAENRQSKNIRPVEAKSVEFNAKLYFSLRLLSVVFYFKLCLRELKKKKFLMI
mgnify:CR=1 FL=1